MYCRNLEKKNKKKNNKKTPQINNKDLTFKRLLKLIQQIFYLFIYLLFFFFFGGGCLKIEYFRFRRQFFFLSKDMVYIAENCFACTLSIHSELLITRPTVAFKCYLLIFVCVMCVCLNFYAVSLCS